MQRNITQTRILAEAPHLKTRTVKKVAANVQPVASENQAVSALAVG
jgi:hypothetical protein